MWDFWTSLDPAGCQAGGRCEIRTHEELTPLPVFKTGAFNRSANLPHLNFNGLQSARILPPGVREPDRQSILSPVPGGGGGPPRIDIRGFGLYQGNRQRR